jgi:hypothetical protein
MRLLYRAMTAVMAAAALTSCSSITPVKVSAGDQCFRCRRAVVDERLAGETIDANGFVAKFRAPGCMAKYLVTHPSETGAEFVTDYATGKMISPDAAFFVPVVLDPNTGERDYRAYRLKPDANVAATGLGSAPVDWKTVLDKART